MRESLVFLLVCFVNDLLVPSFVGKKCFVEISDWTVDFCKFISIYGFYLHLDYFKILEQNVSEFMVEMIDINDVLECGRLKKGVIFTEGQRITADAVVIVARQKIPGLCFIIDGETTGTEDFHLLFD